MSPLCRRVWPHGLWAFVFAPRQSTELDSGESSLSGGAVSPSYPFHWGGQRLPSEDGGKCHLLWSVFKSQVFVGSRKERAFCLQRLETSQVWNELVVCSEVPANLGVLGPACTCSPGSRERRRASLPSSGCRAPRGQFDIGHDGNIYTLEIGTCYTSRLFFLDCCLVNISQHFSHKAPWEWGFGSRAVGNLAVPQCDATFARWGDSARRMATCPRVAGSTDEVPASQLG